MPECSEPEELGLVGKWAGAKMKRGIILETTHLCRKISKNGTFWDIVNESGW
jgi:hypothetical protein